MNNVSKPKLEAGWLSMKSVREEQAELIGKCGILGSYHTCRIAELDMLYFVDAYEQLTLICRRHSADEVLSSKIATGREFDEQLTQLQRQNILFMGTVTLAQSITRADAALRASINAAGLMDEPGIVDCISAYEGARRVQARRELKRATDKNMEFAEMFSLEPHEALARAFSGQGIQHFDSSCEVSLRMGVSRDFVNRQRARLGLSRM